MFDGPSSALESTQISLETPLRRYASVCAVAVSNTCPRRYVVVERRTLVKHPLHARYLETSQFEMSWLNEATDSNIAYVFVTFDVSQLPMG